MKTLKRCFLIPILFAVVLALFIAVVPVKADGDTTAPVISVPDVTVRTYTGSEPILEVTAIDDTDGDVAVNFGWSADALDDLGRLTEGEHTCTLTATDAAENTATVTITYIVTADTVDNSGYAFVTLVCDGMDNVVKAYTTGSAIDMTAYPERDGYTRTVKTADGTVITDFTATKDVILYVTYVAEAKEEPNVDEQTGGCGSSVSGAAALLPLAGISLIKIRKNRGGDK